MHQLGGSERLTGLAVWWEIREGDCMDRLPEMDAGSVQCVVTSPPYYQHRDYGTGTWTGGDVDCDHVRARGVPKAPDSTLGGSRRVTEVADRAYGAECGRCGAVRVDQQIGLETSLGVYIERLVNVFARVRRVLADDGTVWLNLGDSYGTGDEFRSKDLLLVPARVALALQADGWYLRSDIIYSKPNPVPESVTDRPTSAHEHIFLLTKQARYFYDANAIREPDSGMTAGNGFAGRSDHRLSGGLAAGGTVEPWQPGAGRNKRNVWEVPTNTLNANGNGPVTHFATYPPKLIEPCILAGSRPGDVILDPFTGAGTTGIVALRHDRSFLGVELNPLYADLARWRIRDDAPLLNTFSEVGWNA